MKKSRAERGKAASVKGFANEHIVAGILMRKLHNVSLVDLPLSPYDLIIVLKDEKGKEDIIRAQIKTAEKSISFTGGTRGGVDRFYISGVKEYVQNPKTSDVVIGIRTLGENEFDLYFIPTILIERLNQKSISINKVENFKNNYKILLNCKNENFVISFAKEVGIIK